MIDFQTLVFSLFVNKDSSYVGGYLIWTFLGPSQIGQLKSPPNINRFTVSIDWCNMTVNLGVICIKVIFEIFIPGDVWQRRDV